MKIEKWDEVNGRTTPDERMEAFLEGTTDAYAILQLRRVDETEEYRFMPYRYLQTKDEQPVIDHYEVVYSGPMEHTAGVMEKLEELFIRFNTDHPKDYHGHSMSISDIVALKTGNEVSCYYVDSGGFVEIPDFLKLENYLKNAEMAMEDDYGMLDGIINNGKAINTEGPSSVLEQLKEMLEQNPPHKVSKSHPEREME